MWFVIPRTHPALEAGCALLSNLIPRRMGVARSHVHRCCTAAPLTQARCCASLVAMSPSVLVPTVAVTAAALGAFPLASLSATATAATTLLALATRGLPLSSPGDNGVRTLGLAPPW